MKPSTNLPQNQNQQYFISNNNNLNGARGRNRTGTASRWCSIVQGALTVLLDLSDSGH